MAVMPGTEGQIDQQKAALLSVIAQQGSQGQVAFNAEAERRKQQQIAAQSAIAARSGASGNGGAPQALTAQLQAQQNALGSIYAQDAAMSGQTFQNSINLTNSSNDAYLQQARAAVPIVRSQTEGTIAQIRAEQEDARAQREYEAQQRILDAQAADEDRAFQREQMAFEREQMKEDEGTENGDKFLEEIAKGQEEVVNESLRKDPPNDFQLFNEAVAQADNIPDAIEYANRLIKEMSAADAEDGGTGKVIDGNSRRRLAERIYKYFTLKDPPADTGELDKALKAEGASYQSIDPTYDPQLENRKKNDSGQSSVRAGSRKAASATAQEELRRKVLAGLSSYYEGNKNNGGGRPSVGWWDRGRVRLPGLDKGRILTGGL